MGENTATEEFRGVAGLVSQRTILHRSFRKHSGKEYMEKQILQIESGEHSKHEVARIVRDRIDEFKREKGTAETLAIRSVHRSYTGSVGHLAGIAAGDRTDQFGKPRRLSDTELWSRVRDAGCSVAERTDALYECVSREPERAASFIVGELSREDIASDWCNELVLTAEDVQFHEPDQRWKLAQRLLELARSMRHDADAETEPVIRSAIRCYASLIPPTEAATLQEFLEAGTYTGTRLVALRSIANHFEPGPPADKAPLGPLSERIAELAEKLLDPDVFVAGEKAAIAQNAIHALACIGDPRVQELLVRVRQLRRQWLVRQIRLKLERTLRSWERGPLGAHPAMALLRSHIAQLQ